jgi:S-adenosylmethionine-diacylgycerolhomoserine-N-methlytransferase
MAEAARAAGAGGAKGAEPLEAHRRFLNAYYGPSKHIYDVTRKYYLFGRDRALRALAEDNRWTTLVEIGPGTGRNLAVLHRARPDARLGGVEASDEMLAHARGRCPWASFVRGFAESADVSTVHGEAPDRILFSYCLSMVGDAPGALKRARDSLAPGGQVLVVDFADMAGMPVVPRKLFRAWLRTFHVTPLDVGLLEDGAASVTYGPMRYYAISPFGRRANASETHGERTGEPYGG